MKVVGIITEYNPFHQGHKYHIEESKKRTNADYVVAVMSGNYVQRGAPAIMDKHDRAKLALLHGVDLVLELPACYACASAEFFAKGAVSLLDGLGVITHLSFGSEYGELSPFIAAAKILVQEPEAYRQLLKAELKKGRTFPAARGGALRACLTESSFPAKQLLHFLAGPNNILGLEYCKALAKLQSSIQPITIRRKGNAYHNITLDAFASAAGIREELKKNPRWTLLQSALPAAAFTMLQKEYGRMLPLLTDDFSLLLRYRLLTETAESLCAYQDVSPALARRMKKLENQFVSFSQFAALLKTKDMTYTRVCRSLLHILLYQKALPPIAYARALGMKKDASSLLLAIKEKSRLPLLTKLANSDAQLSFKGQKALTADIFASNLYESVLCQKFGKSYLHEYQKQIVIL